MSTLTKTGTRLLVILLCAIILLSNIPGPAYAAGSESVQSEDTVSNSSGAAFDHSSLDSLNYAHGTVSAWLEYDCGNGIMTDGTYRSYLQVAVDTDYDHFLDYCAALSQNANYTQVYTDEQYGCIGDSTAAVSYARYKASDCSHTVYVYILNQLNEVRVIVDTNPDMTGIYANGFTYESTTGETAQPMVVMYGLSMAENGYSIDTSNTQYNTGKVNSGALIVIRMPDNSLFINDGGSVEQWNDEACDRFMTFLREMTGKSQGEKVVINTWFLSHAHTDHFEGFTRFVDHCHDQLDLKSVMYNIDSERLGTARDITYLLQLLRAYFPAVHYYKPHTGERFNIAGIDFDVVYAQEDRFYPTFNGQELIIDHLDGKSEYAEHDSRNGTYRDECFKETVYSYDTDNDTLVATPTTYDYSDFNDTSTVIKVTFPAEIINHSEDISAILYGDVNRVDQTMLKVYSGTDMLKANIMLIPHHGHDAHPQLVEASEADVFLYTQRKSAIYGPNGIVDYGVDIGGTYRPALVYNYMAMQDHLKTGRTYWQGEETVCLTFGAAQNLPSGMTQDTLLSASTGIYGYTCDTIDFKYEGWTVVTAVSGSNEAAATGVEITMKRIRFDQVTALTNQGRYLIVHDQTDNVLLYNPIASASGQTKPNLAISMEVGSGQEASAGLTDAYYKVNDSSRPDVENKVSIYCTRDKRDSALWILGQDGVTGSGTALETSSAMFGGSTAYASTALYKGTSSDDAYWYSISGNDYVDSSKGNQWRYLRISGSPVFYKNEVSTNTIEFFDDGTCVIYYYSSDSSIRFLTITPEGNWVRKVYKRSEITDDVLSSLKLRMYQYTTRSGAKTIAYNGPQNYDVLINTGKKDVINSIASTFKVIDSSVRNRLIPCSGTTAKVGYYWLSGTISTSSASSYELTLNYRNDDGTDSPICTVRINVVRTLDLGTVLSGTHLNVTVNQTETDGKVCQVYHNASGYFTEDTAITLDMLTTSDGSQVSSETAGEYTDLTLTYNGQVLSSGITLTVAEEIPDHNCTDPQGHTWADATCETPKTCITCGTTEGEALGHSYSGGKCSNCGDVKVVSISASFNSWGGEDMTWTESGYSFSKTLPAGTYGFKLVKDGSWLGNNSTIKDTTSGSKYEFTDWGENCTLVTTGGYYYFYFDFDTNQLSISFSHLHGYTVSEVVLPTCTSKGYTVYTCPCGSSYESNETAALDHDYSCVTTPPTCTENGSMVYTCIHCGHSYTESTAALNHNYVGGKCSNCGDTKLVTVNGSFNNWGGDNMDWTENGYTFTVDLQAGTYQFKIIRDGTWLGNNGSIENTTTATSDIGWEFTAWGGDCSLIASGGTYCFTFHYDTNMLVITYDHSHSYEAVVTAPTCTEGGYTTYTCAVCGDSYVADEVDALGHSWTDATCTAPKTCSVCGVTEGEALGHSWTDATCTAPKTCSVCGATEGDALGHASVTYSFVNNVHTFTCDVCGEVAFTKTEGNKFAINSAAPVLADDIVMKYNVTIPAGFENAYMVFDFNGESFTITDYEIDASTGRYAFKFPGINPQKMGDNICATVYAHVEGYQVSAQIASYSMVKYLDNQLKKATLPAATRTIFSDVLAYGEAAQILQGYKTDALVTTLLSAGSTLTPSSFPEALDASLDLQKRTGTADSRVQFTGVTLSLGSKMAVRVSVTCTDLQAFTYKVEISGREYTYTGEDLVPVTDGSDGKYYLYFNQVKASELDQKITFTCWEGETQVSYTIEYSVYTFVYRNYTKASLDENTRNMLKAIYVYGESVKNA